jgi:hypothetical protein
MNGSADILNPVSAEPRFFALAPRRALPAEAEIKARKAQVEAELGLEAALEVLLPRVEF